MLLYKSIIGSQLYGTNLKDSDLDILEVYLEPITDIFGIKENHKIVQEISEGNDIRKFFLKEFMKLNFKGNPNTLECLWATNTIYEHPLFTKYIKNFRHIFLTKNLIHPHLGFARSQIYKMTNKQYVGQKRKELIKDFGYDVRFACHSIRLLKQLQEILKTNNIKFPLKKEDCDLIKDVKQGKFTSQQFIELFDDEYSKTENIIINDSKLPTIEPDINKVNGCLLGFYKEIGY